MPTRADSLLNDVLALPAAARAEIAYELVASLDGEMDDDAEAAWAAEIERRVEFAKSGGGSVRPWSAERDRIASALRRKE
jgi:putative addiction module component (TIGR02574 family)